MKKRLVIFDFDGVLADSFDILYKMNALAFKACGGKLTKKQYRDFFTGDFNENLKKFCGNEKKYEEMTALRNKIKEKKYKNLKLFPEAKALILRLKNEKVNMGIVSVNPEYFVKRILDKFNLSRHFNFILSSGGESKTEIIKRATRSNGYKTRESYFVTDTLNDLLYGKEAGIKTIAALWGFHPEELLLKGRPDFLLKNCGEIFSIVKN